jgi:CDP-glycerol glycerophosphotransferase (TagB/SpsB family)
LIEAISALPQVHLSIKPHPAETPALYAPLADGRPNVSLAPPDADLATLLAAADGLVTKNSTVAIDGMVLGLPALVIGLPNNLTPFVDAGVMLGADGPEKIRQSLEMLLYDRQVRQRIAEAAGAFVQEYDLAPQPGAARRAADRILALAKRT